MWLWGRGKQLLELIQMQSLSLKEREQKMQVNKVFFFELVILQLGCSDTDPTIGSRYWYWYRYRGEVLHSDSRDPCQPHHIDATTDTDDQQSEVM